MPKAIYEGIYREIRSRIINGTYAFQEMLPTEAELTAEFGCTRNTVRRALGMLADGMYVQPIHGKGVRVIWLKGETDMLGALEEVEATGYGIVMPTMDELKLDEPKIVKQGGKYGVRLRASAPSIHMMSANITTEINPIVGSEKQSEELIAYLLTDFEENPKKIWESNIFGKSLHELVNEGLHNKLYRMPSDARMKLQETIQRIINEGCGGLICIIL